jgi:signal transduction histidine kinase
MATPPTTPEIRFRRTRAWFWWVGTALLGAVVVWSGFVEVVVWSGVVGQPPEAERPSGPNYVVPDAWLILLLLVSASSLFIRRQHPFVTLVVTVLLAVLARTFGLNTGGFELAALVALFSFASRAPRRATVVAAASSAVLLIGATVISGADAFMNGIAWDIVAGVGFASALGVATKLRRANLQSMTDRAEHAERTRDIEAQRRVAEDRLRIARDLHDSVAHQIAVINLHAGVASQALASRPADTERSLNTIREAAREVLGEISSLLQVLRTSGDPDAAAPLGLARLPELIAGMERNHFSVTRIDEGTLRPLPASIDEVAFRVIQEALTNAYKHGSTNTALVRLAYTPTELQIDVSNATKSGLPEAALAHGNGLIGMRERVKAVGGTMSVEPGGSEFVLHVTVPTAERLAS